MSNTSIFLSKLIELKNILAKNLSNLGVSASISEKYNSLIDKVSTIPIDLDKPVLNGEEIVLENTTKYNDTPSSIVSVEYPDIVNMAQGYKTTISNGVTFTVNDDMSITVNGTNTSTTSNAYIVFVSNLTLETNNTYAWDLDISSENIGYTLGKVQSNIPAVGTYTPTKEITDSYLILYVAAGKTVNNVTVRQPIFYKQSDIGVQLQSKNLIPYPYNLPRLTSNGITYTVNSDSTITANGTFENINATSFVTLISDSTATAFKLPLGKTYTISGAPQVEGVTTILDYCNLYNGQALDSAVTQNGNSATFTTSTDVDMPGVQLQLKSQGTVPTINNVVFKPQIELGSTATSYTKYISDFSSSKLNVSGKNLIPYPYSTPPNRTNNGITYTVNTDGTITANGTFEDKTTSSYITITTAEVAEAFKLPLGKTYTISGSPEVEGVTTVIDYCNLRNGQALDSAVTQNGNSATFTTSTDVDMPGVQLQLKSQGTVTTVENVVFKPQIELGSTATDYSPYQGTTYTANADGIVSNVKNIYPLTNLISDSDTTMTVSSGTYKQITPSSGKNSFTKAYQPTVDSSIDSNIKPEYIRKGVTILGVTGTYEPTTEES